MEKEETNSMKTHIVADLIKEGRQYVFIITNKGKVPATDVDFTLSNDSDVFGNTEFIPIIHPGQTFKYNNAITLDDPDTFTANVSWVNLDKTADSSKFHLKI